MTSNNSSMIYKKIRLSFINKSALSISLVILLAIAILCSWFVVAFVSTMPILVKIFWLLFDILILASIVFASLNGMIIMSNGTVVFVPDFRIKTFHSEDLKRVSLIFNEQVNDKYSVTVKFVYHNGSNFTKNYAKQFENIRNKKLVMSIYTITKKKVNKICNKILGWDISNVTVINKSGEIVYQKV